MRHDLHAIARLRSVYLKLAILAAPPRSKVFAGFRIGFPHLFTNRRGREKIPLSLLKLAAREYAICEGYDAGDWERAGELSLDFAGMFAPALRLPIAHRWETGHAIPEEVLRGLHGQKTRAGVTVRFQGIEFLVAGVVFDSLIQIGELVTSQHQISELLLVEAKFVDLDA